MSNFSMHTTQSVNRIFSGLMVSLVLMIMLVSTQVSGQTEQTTGKVSKRQPTELQIPDSDLPHLRELKVESIPDDRKLKLTGPVPHIVRVWVKGDPKQKAIRFQFNPAATEITIHLPKSQTPGDSTTLSFLVSDNSATLSDGVIVLSALDSEVVGDEAGLETHPGNHRIGFWNHADDYVKWSFDAPAGKYQVQLVYSRAPATGTQVTIQIDDSQLDYQLVRTGSWYIYDTVHLGDVSVEDADAHTATVKVKKIKKGVMNLKGLILTPVKPPQKDSSNSK